MSIRILVLFDHVGSRDWAVYMRRPMERNKRSRHRRQVAYLQLPCYSAVGWKSSQYQNPPTPHAPEMLHIILAGTGKYTYLFGLELQPLPSRAPHPGEIPSSMHANTEAEFEIASINPLCIFSNLQCKGPY